MAAPQTPLRVVVAGATVHAEWYAAVMRDRADMKIVGFLETDDPPGPLAHRLPALAMAHGVPYVITLSQAETLHPDIVVVATEPNRHRSIVEWAAERRVHILVDKPIATSYDDARAIASLACTQPLVATYVHRCFSPAIVTARECVDRGDIGLPRTAHCVLVSAYQHRDDEPGRVALDPVYAGGGEVMNFAGYAIDYLHHITGLRVESVFATMTARTSPVHAALSVESFGVLSLTLERGFVASLTVGRSPKDVCRMRSQLTLVGSLGALHVDETRPSLRVATTHPTGGDPHPNDGGFTELIDDFVHAIRTDGTPARSLGDGADNLAVIEAAYMSSRTRQPQAVSYG